MTKLSIIVIGYEMPGQLANTLYSLSVDFQKNVSADDYEVIVVENSSSSNMDPAIINHLSGHFSHFLRDEPGTSPVPAFNAGLREAKGDIIGILIDGARLITPRVLEHVLRVHTAFESPLIAIPGYHIGTQEHEFYGPERIAEEQALLTSIDWKNNGYDIFHHACFSAGNRRGYFHPMMECNALFTTRKSLKKIDDGDERFNLPGGGSYNLHLYRSLGILPENQLVILPGEGSFHQFHGGVTTSSIPDREAKLKGFNEQLNSFWNGQFKALTREPILYGNIPAQALPFMELSTENGKTRFTRLSNQQRPFWPDDQLINGE